ncbi:MAG: hypothetical protein ABIO16_12630 [Nocardioides sp.]
MTTDEGLPRNAAVDARGPMPVLLVAAAAVVFPLVYLASDLVEVVQGDFSVFRLSLTYVGEAGFPLFVTGLCVLLRDRLPWWGFLGGIAYAYSFVFFTSTVVWAIVAHTSDWEALTADFGWWMTTHGAVMVVGGVALGLGVTRSHALPVWTGYVLVLGVVLVALASGMGNVERTVAAALPDLAFVGMGVALAGRRLAIGTSESPDRHLQSISGNVRGDE